MLAGQSALAGVPSGPNPVGELYHTKAAPLAHTPGVLYVLAPMRISERISPLTSPAVETAAPKVTPATSPSAFQSAFVGPPFAPSPVGPPYQINAIPSFCCPLSYIGAPTMMSP